MNITEEQVTILKYRSIAATVGIVVLVIGIYLNSETIKNVKKDSANLSIDEITFYSRLNSILAILVALTILYINYRETQDSKIEEYPKLEKELKIQTFASILVVVSAVIIIYLNFTSGRDVPILGNPPFL